MTAEVERRVAYIPLFILKFERNVMHCCQLARPFFLSADLSTAFQQPLSDASHYMSLNAPLGDMRMCVTSSRQKTAAV